MQNGVVLDGDELLFIIARHRHAAGRLPGGVVGTLMSNFGLEQALGGSGDSLRANQGRRPLRARGAEEAQLGSWAAKGPGTSCVSISTPPATASCRRCRCCAAMMVADKTPGQRRTRHGEVPQSLINVSARNRGRVVGLARVKHAVSEADTSTWPGRGRVLLRPSGTEPLVRVMVEGQDRIAGSAPGRRTGGGGARGRNGA